MKVPASSIRSVGLTTLYHPDDPHDAVVDVVLVHGIGGHPVRTWKWVGKPEPPLTPKSAKSTGSFRRLLGRHPALRRSTSEPVLLLGTKTDSSGRSRKVLRKNSLKSSSRLRLQTEDGVIGTNTELEVYWPLDLLPETCPDARIMTWGHHTLVAGGQPLRLQGGVFAHAKELLLDLVEAREATNTKYRPIIFVAHSTGGLLVKELLRLAESENEGPLRPLLLSTSATVFLGTPHRASEHASLGDAIRSMAGLTLGIDSRDPVLCGLSGSASRELELGREAFIRVWDNYNFRVKTFQETLANNGNFLELRAGAAVRRLSSFIGHQRESAETVSASHLDMCRFSSADDKGYGALASTLARCVELEASRRSTMTDKERVCLAALAPKHMPITDKCSNTTNPGTWLWLYALPEFQVWHHRSDRNKERILWITGESGSGKSTLLRSLRGRIERQWAPAGGTVFSTTAAGQGTAGGTVFSTTAAGQGTSAVLFRQSCCRHADARLGEVYRSILAQLFLHDLQLRKAMVALCEKQPEPSHALPDSVIVSFFVDKYSNQRIETAARRTFIFVDVSDDCVPSCLHDLLGHLFQLARNSDFSICVASGNPLGMAEQSTIEISMQHRNTDDILRHVNLNLVAEWEERNRTVVRIGQKAAGVFLWAEIVVNILNAAIDEGGAPQDLVEDTLEEIPDNLHGLYGWMLNTLHDDEKQEARLLFQWAILAAEPMRLDDLLVAVRLTRTWRHADFQPCMALDLGPPTSLRQIRPIRNSSVTTGSPAQLAAWIQSRSIGLLMLRPDAAPSSSSSSSTQTSPPGLQRVVVPHDSVRAFFLSGGGFATLTTDPTATGHLSTADLVDRAHYACLHACLRYLAMRDFEPLVGGGSGPSTETAAASQQQQQQRGRLVTASSHPFLRYAAHHALYHLLSPTHFRYFLPQTALLRTLGAGRGRLWRRWTALLGSTDVVGVCGGEDGSAGELLSPVFGARFRLERVFGRLRRVVVVGGEEPDGILGISHVAG